MKRVADLSGAELDYYVARALGLDFRGCILRKRFDESEWLGYEQSWGRAYGEWSSSWEDAGPIIQRERIVLFTGDSENDGQIDDWAAIVGGASVGTYLGMGGFGRIDARGPTPLIAAMRALVASVYGEEVSTEEDEL